MDKIARPDCAVQFWELGHWRAQPPEATEQAGIAEHVAGTEVTAAEKSPGAQP